MRSDPQGPFPAVVTHGKFLSRGDAKFFVKAIRLIGGPGGADFAARVELRARLVELAAGNTTALILRPQTADSTLDMAAVAGLYAMIEIPICAEKLLDRAGLKSIRAELTKIARRFRDHSRVFGFLLDTGITEDWLRLNGLPRIQRRLAALVSHLKAESRGRAVAVLHQPSTCALVTSGEDLVYSRVPETMPQQLMGYLASLHNIAESRPVLIELEAGGGDQDERIACAFAAGVAGVVAPPFRPRVRAGSLDLKALDPGEILPFLALNGNCPPSPRKAPMVSVVICAYNAEQTMEACLKSLRALDYPNYEVIVVDDGSRDATAEIAARFPEFRLIRQPNKGLSVARNVGMHAGLGEIIAYTDSDCVADPHWLTLMVGAMLGSGFDGCGGPNYAPHEKGRIEGCVSASPGAPCHVLTAPDRAEHLAGCNMVFRKAALQKLGGFDPQFTAAGDDVDICWRALDAGLVLGFCPAAFVWHFRRNTVKAYYKQQRGYGKAEALLYLKYPERFNVLGQVKWQGTIPGLARTIPGVGRSLVSWASNSRAFFQTIYEPPMGLLRFLPQTLEWNALWSAILIVSIGAGLPIIPSLTMLALGPIWALYYARKAPLERCHEGLRSRLLVAFLAYTGPMARAITRYRYRLGSAWTGRSAVEPAIRQRPTIQLLQRAIKLAYWSESGTPRDALIDRLVRVFARGGMAVRVDSGWNDYDLEVRPDAWTQVQIKTADEKHGGGRLKTLVQARVRLSTRSRVLMLLSIAAAAVGVALRTFAIDLMLAGLGLVVASLAASNGLESGRLAYWAIEGCAAELGLIPLGKPTAATAEASKIAPAPAEAQSPAELAVEEQAES